MSSNWFNQWCAKSPNRAKELLADMRAMGIDVPSLDQIPTFTTFQMERPRALEDPLPLYIFSTLHLRTPDWENTHRPNGYLRKSLYSVLWFGIEEIIKEDGTGEFSVVDIQSHRNRLRAGLSDLFPLSQDAVQQIVVPHADLSRFDLSGLDLADIDLSHSRISWRMRASNLTNTNLSFVKGDVVHSRSRRKVTGEWETTHYSHGVDFRDSQLDYANFSGAHLEYSRFDSCSMLGVSFANANLRHCSFVGADLRGARFSKFTNLEGANFTDARFDKVELQGSADEQTGGIGLAIHLSTRLVDGALSNRNSEVLQDEEFRRFRAKFFEV